MNIRRSIAAAGLAGGLLLAPIVANAGDGGPEATYRITIENIATGFQPLSPAGVAVHDSRTDVWSVGSPATNAVAAIAEDANLPVFVGSYAQAGGVADAFVGGAAPIGPGGSDSFEFDARPGSRVSLVSMLVNTNDAFTGLDGIVLGGATEVFEVGAYDAGTEINNEMASHIPGPVGGNAFVRAPEAGVITHHDGIQGVGDIPASTAWTGPVARITVERLG